MSYVALTMLLIVGISFGNWQNKPTVKLSGYFIVKANVDLALIRSSWDDASFYAEKRNCFEHVNQQVAERALGGS